MRRPFDGAVGQVLALDDFYADFSENFARCREFWKLERGQVFAEPGDASWLAFDRGDWQEAIRLIEERRADLVEYHREIAAGGNVTRRIRIVEFPLTPYLQWELHFLKTRSETGGEIRVLMADEVSDLEYPGPLPELFTLDDRVMYEPVYDENGVAESGLRYTGTELVRGCRDFIAELFGRGEPIAEFFRREVAQLSPPVPNNRTVRSDYLEVTGRPKPIRS